MKLDRNVIAAPAGKYALIKIRRLAEIRSWNGGEGEIFDQEAVEQALALLERAKIIDWCDTPETEAFVIRLKDEFAQNALFAYSLAADVAGESEYASEVRALSKRSGVGHPHCRRPD